MVTPKGLCSGVMLGVGGSIPPQLTSEKCSLTYWQRGTEVKIEVARPKSPNEWYHATVTIYVVKL